MQLYEMQVTKTAIIRTAPARIPKGIIGAAVRLSFSPEWEGLHKTVVFRAGNVTKDVLDVENEVVIPAECTEEAGALLEVGVYGVDGENSVAIPTLWAAIGRVCEATDPSGDTTTDPSLPVWAQLREMIRQLEEQGVTQNEVDRAVQDYFGANPVTAQSIGAAPAGFGLGDAVTLIDSWNNAIKTGFYRAEKDSATGQWMYGYVVNYANNISTQVAFSHSATTLNIALRAGMDGNWQPWEWVNPPMVPGVEYRTTERIHGLAVYKKSDGTNILYRLENESEWKKQNTLMGAAPAGYGYGEVSVTAFWNDEDGTQLEASLDMFFADPNKLDKVYRFKLVDYPACVVSGQGGFADIMCTDQLEEWPMDITIVYYSLHGIATKQKLRGEWYPWEYVSPPLEPGVEYRTTERINNLPVYVQRVNVGVFPEADGTSVEVKTGIEFGDIVRLSANIGKWSLPFLDRQIVSAGYYTDPEDGKYKISVLLYTKIDRSLGGAADVTLYYTK